MSESLVAGVLFTCASCARTLQEAEAPRRILRACAVLAFIRTVKFLFPFSLPLTFMHKQEGEFYHTGVIFRTFTDKTGGTIALFTASYRDGTCNHGFCMSYMHVGQHSEVLPSAVIAQSRPATPEEYAPLKTELQNIGYRFKRIYKRFPRA